eukprot:CAMPEP_0201488292 /NCGR_PEP_ID=MMETSP0151_2-20130828/17873_1 /ASSEMBLY_ACC=CAM_ASM_000257 /TAXON_ID=200890 /ORGANISM="Paramoeba atlantica, Strain 621/1 / CCAP 1560/9" /LENGTH=355 /DNA_ID=CAMNT_0047873551 /DNA_START=58 /DNA_END=1125 /DNA_ORIENTATION=+
MGQCGSTGDVDQDSLQKNKEINVLLKENRTEMDHTLRILLLGSGESGKSTFFKQMRILYMDGISENEVSVFRNIIYANIVLAIRTLTAASAKLGFQIEPDNRQRATFFTESIAHGTKFVLDAKLGDDVKALWNDPAIQSAFAQSHRFQLPDSTRYFMESLDRISDKKYLPTTEDILRCRSKTTGICEISFKVDDVYFKMVDVGGQRSERTKWIKCFEDVTAIIYFLSLSEYNLSLFEDPSVNRMQESFRLFTEIVNSKWFTETPVILFLNKRDIFKEKIEKNEHPLSNVFPEFPGGDSYDEAVEFIKKKLLSQNTQDKTVFTHVTCCTDTGNIKYVFESVREYLMQEAFKQSFVI